MSGHRRDLSNPSSATDQPRVPIEVVVFVVGAASLGAEIAAARLLAPYFGASTIVWANTIAVVLVSLSVGYWWGGRMADRAPRHAALHRLIVAGGVLLAVVPLAGRPFLNFTIATLDTLSVGAFFGSLVGVLVLVAGPVLILGAVAPFAIRLSIVDVADSGATAGRLYAISTAGSLVGTFVAALLFVPFVGTHRTFLLFGFAVALVGALGLPRRWLLAPALLGAALLLRPVGIETQASDERVLSETETAYQYVRVIENSEGTRSLQLNDSFDVQSIYHAGRWLTDDYWDDFLVLPIAALGHPPRTVAILGNGGGTTAREYGHFFPRTRIDGVDIDPKLRDIARRWFDLRGPRLRLIAQDARPFLRANGRYDAVFVDAYREPEIPFYLTTREFFELCRRHLRPGGVVLTNVAHTPGSDVIERVITRTLRAVFPVVVRDAVGDANTIVMASAAPVRRAAVAAYAPHMTAELRGVGLRAAARIAPGLRGGQVYTDDRAPIEWLLDRDIITHGFG